MRRYILYVFVLLSSGIKLSCMESYLGIEKLDLGTNNPEKLTVNKVIPKSGELEIHFTLPKGNPNNVHVVASYINKAGKRVEFKVSRYSNVINVEGFMGTDEVTVELTTVDESGKKSDVVLVKEKPLLSPVEEARKSLLAEPAFGGVKLSWANKQAQPFAIHVLTMDEIQLGQQTLMEDVSKTIYSQDSLNTSTYLRQYENVEQTFGFVLTDKWGNRTDTLINQITPYKEDVIDYNLVQAVNYFSPSVQTSGRDYNLYGVSPTTGIQNDGTTHNATAFAAQSMFNGNSAANEFLAYKFWIQPPGVPAPPRRYVQDLYATFDINMDVRLSRVIVYPRPSVSYLYARSSVKRFRIWGTDDTNNNRWSKFPEGWTLIGEYVGKEPANRSAITAEETDYFYNRQEYSIAENNVNPDASPTKTFRYMRLQFMETYTPTETFYSVNEFKMFGEVLNKYK